MQVKVFKQYEQDAYASNNRRRTHFHNLPKRHKDLLVGYCEILSDIDGRISENADLLAEPIKAAFTFLEDDGEGESRPCDAERHIVRLSK